MNSNRNNAKALHKQKKYTEALPLYKALWDSQTNNKTDCWLGWEYADTLKRLDMLDEAIAVCKTIFKADKNFKYNTDLLAWCLYEKYIKSIDKVKSPEDINKILNIADFITNISKQEKGSPYEYSVWAIIKLLKNAASFNALKIDYWLNKLSIELLSDVPFSYTDETGKQREVASKREDWYTLKCKVLLKTNKYKEYIELCDIAAASIKKFHYDNDIWMAVKKAYCIGMLGNMNQAIKLLKSLLTEKEHWSIHETIFDFNVLLENSEEGLAYAYNAALSKDPAKMKVKLFYSIGKVLESFNNKEYALMHYIFCKKLREENSWKVPAELEKAIVNISDNGILINEENLYKDLRSFWLNEKIRLAPREKGVISNILTSGKAGFIKGDNGSYYFQIQSILKDKYKLKRDLKVSFTLKDSFDKRKNIPTKEAVDIIFL